MLNNRKIQRTVSHAVEIDGIGVHSGERFSMTICPGEPDTGFVFQRTDLAHYPLIRGQWDLVSDTRMCTQLTNDKGVSIGTVEHLLAALVALEIDNALIQVNGPEIPILDGSSIDFIRAIKNVGLSDQESVRSYLKVLSPIEIKEETRFVRLEPSDHLNYHFSIDFFGGREGMKPQERSWNWSSSSFEKNIAPARTFGFFEDAQKLQAIGLAKGASLENAIVIKEGAVLNTEGLRFPDEFVRHKILDAVGDLALAGAPFLGGYISHNGGHELNNRLLRKIFASPKSYEMVTL